MDHLSLLPNVTTLAKRSGVTGREVRAVEETNELATKSAVRVLRNGFVCFSPMQAGLVC